MIKTPYTYTLLRYVHDVAAGEVLNVGVVVHAPSVRYLGTRIQTKYGRLTRAFPSMNGELHRSVMRSLQTALDSAAVRYHEELSFSDLPDTLEARLHEVLRPDDSSLQWSPPGGGLTEDPAQELESLYKRMVALNDPGMPRHGRTDDDVWGYYRAPLQRAKVLPHLVAHQVITPLDQIEFPNALKNGKWHFLHPLSLDLIDPNDIRKKAHTLIGQMAGLSSAMTGSHLYLMLGEASQQQQRVAMDRALNLINHNLTVEHTIIREAEAESFSRSLENTICHHRSA
jgi:hypothetical protein